MSALESTTATFSWNLTTLPLKSYSGNETTMPLDYCTSPTKSPAVLPNNHLSWQSWCFIGASLISLPVYALVLVAILIRKPAKSLVPSIQKKRFTDAFSNLMVSQGVADILALLLFFFTNTMRSLSFLGPFFYSQRDWAAPLGFDSVFAFAFLRGFGIALFSFQRYWCIVHPLTSTKCKIMHLWKVMVLHWVPSLAFLVAVVLLGSKTYCSEDDVATDVKQGVVVITASLTSGFLILFAIVSLLSYLLLVTHIYKNSVKDAKKKNRELRVSAQVFLQTLAIGSLAAYHLAQAIFAQQGPYNPLREYYPLITVLLSVVNLWTALALSKSLRCDVFGIFGIKKPSPMVVASIMHPHIASNVPSRSMIV